MNTYLIVSNEGTAQVSGDSREDALTFYFAHCAIAGLSCVVRGIICLSCRMGLN